MRRLICVFVVCIWQKHVCHNVTQIRVAILLDQCLKRNVIAIHVQWFSVLQVETEGPGPGAYKAVDSFLKSDKPAFSISKRLKDRAEAESK